MPQSLASIHLHLIFSTKNRAPLLDKSLREKLHGYLAGVLKNIGCPAVVINSVDDHVHVLFELARTVTVSQIVEEVKTSSSKWMKADGKAPAFAWQSGYAVFAVSESNVPAVSKYIADQAEHHHKKSFQDELQEFLEKHRLKYDERYLWD